MAPREGPLASADRAPAHDWLRGCDPTPGIVSVTATPTGLATIWRRTDEGVERTQHRFPSWLLATSVDLLAHVPTSHLPGSTLRDRHGRWEGVDGTVVVELEGGGPGDFRYLVLTDRLAEVEAAMLDAWAKRTGSQPQSFAELAGIVAVWPPEEQLLLLTGRTYYKGMEYADLRRLQFDLETTGLDETRDRIFMVSMRDSTGWESCLDTARMSEAALIERFVALVGERDPDVLENHNIFAFDLRFLARRAASLGVRLALGRDGSEPQSVRDVVHVGERSQRFVRWQVAGREVIDTLHAVRRYATADAELRRHGLKEAARYFGLAKPDREYVPGAEVWATFCRDPERVRRYAGDDVAEADGLSRRLMVTPFLLASMVPTRYERLATDGRPQALLDPLLVRAYLHEGRAIPGPGTSGSRPVHPPAAPELFASGVVRPAVSVGARPLLPRLLCSAGRPPARDALGLLPRLLRQLLAEESAAEGEAAHAGAPGAQHAARAKALRHLASATLPYLARSGTSFGDPQLAAQVAEEGRAQMRRLLRALEPLGAFPVLLDGELALLGLPEASDDALLEHVLAAGQSILPTGVRLHCEGRYEAIYVRDERRAVLLHRDGALRLVGGSPGGAGGEPFGERFVRAAAPLLFAGDVAGLRRLFLATVRRLRGGEVPLDELCLEAVLRQSPAEYRRAGKQDDAYELLLASGTRTWRPGQRVRYFRGRDGRFRLRRADDHASDEAVDAEHYVQRLHAVYCHYFAYAFEPEHFEVVFHLPPGPDTSEDSDGGCLDGIRPLGCCRTVDVAQAGTG